VSGWIGCLVTDALQEVTARTVAEDLETQPFCSRGQIGKFFLVNGAHYLSSGIRWPQAFGGWP
jgi:hypothetical protein